MSKQRTPLPAVDQITGIDQDHGGKSVTLCKTMPAQLTLWQSFLSNNPQKNTDDYSNTVELYDAIPKYFSSKKRMAELRRDAQFLLSLRRHFRHRDRNYVVKITPARIEEKNGVEREYYPSWREELVEEALKKLACDQLNGVYLNGMAGVQFTLYELRKELKSQGHDIHFNDLVKSLLICRRANIAITSQDHNGSEVFMDSSIFPTLIMVKRHEWEKSPKDARCYVQFNPLITQSISSLSYRQFDYATFMTFRQQLTRWLHKRLSHNYTQASMMNPYHILLSTIVQDSALANASRLRDQARYIDESMAELIASHVLIKYEKHVREENKRKIEDVEYIFYPHPLFVAEIVTANNRGTRQLRAATASN